IRRLQRHENVPRGNKRVLCASRVPLPEHERERKWGAEPDRKIPKRVYSSRHCAGEAARSSIRRQRYLIDPPGAARERLDLYRREPASDSRSQDHTPAGATGSAARLCRCPLCCRSARASSGYRTGRRRPAAIPLSQPMGRRARTAQGPPSCAAGGCAAPHPKTHCPVLGLGAVHARVRSEEHTSELQSRGHLVCRLLLEKKKKDRGGEV